METHSLDHICLSFDTRKPKAPFSVMQSRPEHIGRLTNFCELGLFSMFLPWAFKCLQSLLIPKLHPMGWGADLVFPSACRRKQGGVARIAVLDSMSIIDTGTGSYSIPSEWRRMRKFLAMHARDRPVLDSVVHRDLAEVLGLEQ